MTIGRISILCLIGLLLLPMSSHAQTVTLLIDKDGWRGQGAPGTITNDMQWAIIIDTGDNGFAAGLGYNSFNNLTSEQFLYSGGVVTDDFYAFGPALPETQDNSGFPIFGAGALMDEIIVNYDGPVSSGMNWGIIWFATNSSDENDYYGFYTTSGLTIPADGSFTDYSSFFDSITDIQQSANYQFTAAVPEPATAVALGVAGLIGVLLRRRRMS